MTDHSTLGQQPGSSTPTDNPSHNPLLLAGQAPSETVVGTLQAFWEMSHEMTSDVGITNTSHLGHNCVLGKAFESCADNIRGAGYARGGLQFAKHYCEIFEADKNLPEEYSNISFAPEDLQKYPNFVNNLDAMSMAALNKFFCPPGSEFLLTDEATFQ
jgi:hypothetical protein